MPPDPRVTRAFNAMKEMGISQAKVKPVLKNLLKVYDKNWDIIEGENYRVLADAIFDAEDTRTSEKKATTDEEENLEKDDVADGPERPLKRLRLRNHEEHSTQNDMSPRVDGNLLTTAQEEQEEVSAAIPSQASAGIRETELRSSSPQNHNTTDEVSPRPRHSYKGKEPLLPDVSPKEKRPRLDRATHAVQIRDSTSDSAVIFRRKVSPNHLLLKVKDEPITDDMTLNDVSGTVVQPEKENVENEPASSNGVASNGELAIVPGGSSSNLEIASSRSGEVKISVSCNALFGRSDFHMPSQYQLLEAMQEKCLRSYKILDPNFSVKQLLEDMCECFLELGTDTSGQSQETSICVTPTLDVLKKSVASTVLGSGHSKESDFVRAETLNGTVSNLDNDDMAPHMVPTVQHTDLQDRRSLQEVIATADIGSDKENDLIEPGLGTLVVVPDTNLTPGQLRSIQNINDLTKGEELVEIPWLNESDEYPPYFTYIPKSLIYKNAYVNFTLSHVGPDYCCSTCFGDCLVSPSPCLCTKETGYQFVYSSDGLVKEDFLDECIYLTRSPQQQSLYYCRKCVSETSKNDDVIEPCKGHLKRKFIKECWSKCGCNKRCGNRVVQQGISCKLQVFFTQEGKGWGLRTLEKLPKGAFVCEYAGEILTIEEFYERRVEKSRGINSKSHTNPIVLDGLWFFKKVVQEEEALCLDASSYGNIARFINHRCLDANLIEIPVKIESPDHHYYHLAFFTAREVDAMEELTWDYGIEFGDSDNPIEAFSCLCGSKFCRNMKRSNRMKSLTS